MERKKNMKEEIEKVRNEEIEYENKENNVNYNNLENENEENEEIINKEINNENINKIFDKFNKKENKRILLPIKEVNENTKTKNNINSNSNSSNSSLKNEKNQIKQNQKIITLAKNPIQEQKIKKEINSILTKSKIPKFNLEEYTLYGQLGEGSYGIIYEAIKDVAPDIVAEYELEPFSMNVQSVRRTFVDKIFALCDGFVE